MSFPYCKACADRAALWASRGTTTGLIALGVCVLVTLIALAVTPLSLAVVTVVSIFLAVLIGVAAKFALEPRTPPAPATSPAEGVYITSFSPQSARLFFSNPQFAAAYAQASPQLIGYGGEGSHRANFGVAGLIFGLLAAPACAAGFWHLSHPALYVDNPFTTPMTILADGKPLFVVAPNSFEHARLSHGDHELSYSIGHRTGSTAKVSMSMNDVHLYNPGKRACFAMEAVAYGTASTKGMMDGPLPLEEFYTFDKVDNWFTDNPKSVRTKASGETRVAIKLNRACTNLTLSGCSVKARARYAQCQQKAYQAPTEALFTTALETCDDEALNQCERSTTGSGETL